MMVFHGMMFFIWLHAISNEEKIMYFCKSGMDNTVIPDIYCNPNKSRFTYRHIKYT